MAVCFICDRGISRCKITCVDCNNSFHQSCVDNYNKSKPNYTCYDCEIGAGVIKKKNERSLDDLYDQFENSKKQLAVVITNLQAVSLKIDDQNNLLKLAIERLDSVEGKIASVSKRVEELESSNEKCEQQMLNYQIDILGLPVCSDENVVDKVIRLINQGLHVEINEHHIDNCYVVKRDNISKVVVKLTSQLLKNKIIEAKIKNKKSITTAIFDTSTTSKPIFINEAMTAKTRDLFTKAKVMKTEHKYKYLWIRNGNLMMRKDNGERIIFIKTASDLEKIK